MRLAKEKRVFLKKSISSHLPKSRIFLFGSRANDLSKGGDIDILVVGQRKLTLEEKIGTKIDFYKKFGQQKIDIVSYDQADDSTFKNLILSSAIRL